MPEAWQGGFVEEQFSRFLSTDGLVGGTKIATGDYSGAEQEFYIQPQKGQVFRINRMVVYLQDDSVWRAEWYAGIGAALGTGIEVKVLDGDDTVLLDLTDGVPITMNGHYRRFCYDATPTDFGAGDKMWGVRWTFLKDFGNPSPIRLRGDENERLAVILNDDFTDMADHTFRVGGTIEHRRTS